MLLAQPDRQPEVVAGDRRRRGARRSRTSPSSRGSARGRARGSSCPHRSSRRRARARRDGRRGRCRSSAAPSAAGQCADTSRSRRPSPSGGAEPVARDRLGDEPVGKVGGERVGDALGGRAHLAPRRRGHRHRGEHLEHRHRHEDGDGEPRTGERAAPRSAGADTQTAAIEAMPASSETTAVVPACDVVRRVTARRRSASAARMRARLSDAAPYASRTSRLAKWSRTASASRARSGAIARSAREPDAQPHSSDAAPASTRHASRVSAAGHQTNATSTTDPSATALGRDERLDDPQRQILQVVDIVDERAEHRPAPGSGQSVGGEGDEPPHESRARRGELPQRRIVARQPVGVAEGRARDREEPHADDRHRDVEHRRLLARAHDEPGADREQRDGGCFGQEPGCRARPEPPRGRHRPAEHLRRRRGGGCGIRRLLVDRAHTRHLDRLEADDGVGDLARRGAVRDEKDGRAVVGERADRPPEPTLRWRRRGPSSARRAR